MPYGTLDEIMPYELFIMYVGHEENERDELESLYNVVRIAVSSAMSGKNINLFEDKKGQTEGNNLPKGEITEEERTNTLDSLNTLFE